MPCDPSRPPAFNIPRPTLISVSCCFPPGMDLAAPWELLFTTLNSSKLFYTVGRNEVLSLIKIVKTEQQGCHDLGPLADANCEKKIAATKQAISLMEHGFE